MPEEVGLGQADWFANNLQRHYPEVHRGTTTAILTTLKQEEYNKLKRLYWLGYATSDHKTANLEAQWELKDELVRLNIL